MAGYETDYPVRALTSVFSCLVSELHKSGSIDLGSLLEEIQRTSIAHREAGDALLADHIHLLSQYLMESVPDKKAP